MPSLSWLPLAAASCTSADGSRPAPPTAADLRAPLDELDHEVAWIDEPVLPGLGPSWQLRAQRLRSYLEPDGIGVMDRAEARPSWSARLALARWGPPEDLQVAGPGATFGEGSGFEIRRPGLVEWAEARDEGLEHGFTIADGGPETELDLAVEGG